MKKPSLAVYITIWYSVFMIVLMVLFIATISGNNTKNSIERSEEDILSEINALYDRIEMSEGDFRLDEDISYYSNGVYLSVYDEKKRMLSGRTPVFLGYLPELKNGQLYREWDSINEDYWYIRDRKYGKGDKAFWVRGIMENQLKIGFADTLSTQTKIIITLLIIIAIAGGFVISRSALRPVRRLTKTAERIRDDGDLTVRIHTGRRNDEIAALAKAFNSMFERLQKMMKKEKQFTSDVSHELRTPLAVILSTSDYALEDEEFRKEALETVNREARRMNELVGQLLALSRSDSGKLPLNMELVNLSELCENIAEQQRMVLSQEDIIINTYIERNVYVECDESFIIRAVLNLIDNATEYGVFREETGEGVVRHGTIELSLSGKDGFAVIRVGDMGPGIPKEHIDRIWDRFYRADQARSDRGSSGLGLSMVKVIAENHGGSVSVRNRKNGGAEFEITIPV